MNDHPSLSSQEISSLLCAAFDALEDHIAVTTFSGEIVYANTAWISFGESNNARMKDILPGANYFEACKNSVEQSDEEMQLACLALNGIRSITQGTQNSFRLEYPCHSPSERRWFTLRANSFKWENLDYIVMSHNNISDQKQIEHRYQAGFDNLPVGTIVINRHNQIQMFNSAAEKIFGYQKSNVLGKNSDLLIPETDREKFTRYIESYIHSKPAKINWSHHEITGIRKNGETFPMHLGVGTIDLGDDLYYVGSITDLTSLKSAQASLEKALLQVSQANNAKSHFLASMSHEMRTPLNSIIGFSGIMNQRIFGSLGDQHYHDYAEAIERSGEHLLSLVNDILDLSKIESGEYSLNEEVLNIKDIARETMGRFITISVHDVAPTGSFDFPEPAPVLWADKRAVSQILDNLISNAIKYSLPPARINIKWSMNDQGEGVLTVSDQGLGIAAEKIKSVVEPFSQVAQYENSNAHLTRSSPGVGLGLYIVSRLVSLHDASLVIESGLSVGTSVIITFPPTRVSIPTDE